MHIIFTAKYKVLKPWDINWCHFNENIIASYKFWQIIAISSLTELDPLSITALLWSQVTQMCGTSLTSYRSQWHSMVPVVADNALS